MKITAGMLPFELVCEVRDRVAAQLAIDRQAFNISEKYFQILTPALRMAAILTWGAQDRGSINRAITEGDIYLSSCYENCHHCCNMASRYDVETFDILLSYDLNVVAIEKSYLAGLLEADNKWCGLLENGLCSIHQFKPYTCLLTLPSPQGADRGGCLFRGDMNADMSVHKPAMVAAGRMRSLFREYLPELPEFAGSNINAAFSWAVHQTGKLQS